MRTFHIIEEVSTCGQQVVEVSQPTKDKALAVYFEYSITEPLVSTTTQGNITTYDFGDETCTITQVDDHKMFAKWTHKLGLY